MPPHQGRSREGEEGEREAWVGATMTARAAAAAAWSERRERLSVGEIFCERGGGTNLLDTIWERRGSIVSTGKEF